MNIDAVMQLAPVIPVIVIDDAADARPLAEALVAGGLFALEVTLRTPCALEAIAEMAKVEGAVVGAGTVLNEAQLDAAIAAGARFIVSPGLTEPLARAALARGVPLPTRHSQRRRHHARSRPRPRPFQILPCHRQRRHPHAQGVGGTVRRSALLSDRRDHDGDRAGLARDAGRSPAWVGRGSSLRGGSIRRRSRLWRERRLGWRYNLPVSASSASAMAPSGPASLPSPGAVTMRSSAAPDAAGT